jgi:hypothetical protein
MASHGSFPGLPGEGWQQRTVPALTELAAEDARIGGLRVLRDRDAGTDHHRFGGSRWDTWASRLAGAPAPYSPAGITAAIRFYTTMLTGIAVNWDPPPQLDHSPLLELLDAVDLHGAAQ